MDSNLGPEQQYQQFLSNGDFKLQHCSNCNSFTFYPRVACPKCGASKLEWVSAASTGTVYSTTITRRRPDRGGNFNVSIIELDEGPRLMSHVEKINPDDVKIGLAVKARIIGGEEEDYRLVFDALEGKSND